MASLPPIKSSKLPRAFKFRLARYSSAAKSLMSGRVLFCRRLCRHEQRIQPGAVEQFACNNNGINLFCVVDVSERIGCEQNEISAFAGLNCASIAQSEKFGRIAGCGLNRLHGRKPRSNKQCELIVQAGAVVKIWHSAAVGAGQKAYSGRVPFSGDALGFVKGALAGGDI